MKSTFSANEIERAHRKASEKKCENIDISRAANGFSVRVRYAEKPSKKDEAVPYVEPETLVFADATSLVEWLTDVLDES